MRVTSPLGGAARPFSLVLALLFALGVDQRCVCAADCNGNGVGDRDDIELGESADCNVNEIPDECEIAPFSFSGTHDDYPVAAIPEVVTSADLNRDGRLDLVVGSRSRDASTLSVLLAGEDGTFANPVEYVRSEPLRSVATGDLDGDGDIDIATAHSIVLFVWINQGDGTLGAPRVQTFATDLGFVTTADVNGDDALDLVAADGASNTLMVLENRGAAAFAAARSFAVGTRPGSVATGDFDGNGLQDLASVNQDSADVSVLLNQGGGAFAPAVSHAIGAIDPGLVKAGDLNGDGAPDLAVRTRSFVAVLTNNGDGSFAEVSNVTLPRSSKSFELADVDGDGDLDLAVGGTGRVFDVLLNDGGGGFGVAFEYALLSSAVFLTAGDLDQDGDVDLAKVSTNPQVVSVLWNREALVSISRIDTHRLRACPGSCGTRPHTGSVGDVDDDGDIDIVAATNLTGALKVLRNMGEGNFISLPPQPFGTNPQGSALGHINLDRFIDVVIADHSESVLRLHLGRGNGSFLIPQEIPVGAGPFFVGLGDFDGDASLDVASANSLDGTVSVALNNGVGRLMQPTSYRVGTQPESLVVCDLDGDSDVDIAVSHSPSHVSVLRNTGDGTFAESVPHRVTGRPVQVTAADLDGDGFSDLITTINRDQSFSILRNQRDGSFEAARVVPVGRNVNGALAVDFNGDDVIDLISTAASTSTLSILLGRGDGTFRHAEHFQVGNEPRFVHPADFDLDGDVDLVTFNRAGESVSVVFSGELDRIAPDFLETICTPLDFHRISAIPGGSGAVDRFVKFTLPIGDDPSLIPTVFQNTQRFALHQEFLTRVFPDEFPILTAEVYQNLVGRRESRKYFVGTISRIRSAGAPTFGFSVFADFDDATERLTAAEVGAIHEKLGLSFQLEPFAYFPDTRAAIEVAEAWQDPGFPVHFADPTSSTPVYEAYTRGVGFGRVRILDKSEFDAAAGVGDLSFQDILVLDFAPSDIEGVVAGLMTAAVQNPGSHLTVRTTRRGTPNAFLESALEDFSRFEGEFVRLRVKSGGYDVRAATQEEADEWWAANRPTLSALPTVDEEFSAFPGLLEAAALDSGGEGPPVEARFGGKCSNLARLQAIFDGSFERYREQGFGIPMRYYFEFLRSNTITSEFRPGVEVSYEEYLAELFENSEFLSNSRFRFSTLEKLREVMRRDGQVDPELIQSLLARVDETFGFPTTTRVRFRSSSNVEDAIEFNGAGLYDSTSGCPADELDGDSLGPSLCNTNENNERTITRAVKKVWASLWNFRAYEERAFYGIPQELAAMGILCNRTFIDERVNGVAFTGNPTNPFDRRYVVTVQLGEESVVSPEPGVLAEQNVLELEDGAVKKIIRAVPSSLVPAGTHVLSDDDLRELGALMAHIDTNFPLDVGDFNRDEIILDLEFKKTATGELAVKQVRPLLLSDPEPRPTFELEIPSGAVACGVFAQSRDPRLEYELKSMLRLREGIVLLPTRTSSFSGDLVDELVVGPERALAMPVTEGAFTVVETALADGVTRYSFDYSQEFSLPDGGVIQLEIVELDFRAREADAIDDRLVLDEFFLTDEIFLQVTLTDGAEIEEITYGSCNPVTLPLWQVRAELDDGSRLRLEERFRDEPEHNIGPAALTRAQMTAGDVTALVSDYWNLVYTAERHNEGVEYWMVFDAPLTLPGIARPVRAVELIAPSELLDIEARARYLGESFEVLVELGVRSFDRQDITNSPQLFSRGDVNVDGLLDQSDAYFVLQYLFVEGRTPPCMKAADADDSGGVDLTDAMRILLHAFEGQGLPEPLGGCGTDQTADGLTCASFGGCI